MFRLERPVAREAEMLCTRVNGILSYLKEDHSVRSSSSATRFWLA